MPFKFFAIASFESTLNTFICWPSKIKTIIQMLKNSSILYVILKKCYALVMLVFDKYQLDILDKCISRIGYLIIFRMDEFLKTYERYQLTNLLRAEESETENNFQKVQNFIKFFKLTVFDITNLVSLYICDFTDEKISKIFWKAQTFFRTSVQRYQRYIADVIIEEWRIAPGLLEVTWFVEETSAIDHAVEIFTKRLEKLEGK